MPGWTAFGQLTLKPHNCGMDDLALSDSDLFRFPAVVAISLTAVLEFPQGRQLGLVRVVIDQVFRCSEPPLGPKQ